MTRLPRLNPDQLDDAQRAYYQQITSGPRGSGTASFGVRDSAGALAGPFAVMLHAPELGVALQELGSAVRFGATLSDRVREIAILAVATGTGCGYERYAHEHIGRQAGLDDTELTALREGTFHSADPVENTAYAVARRLLATGDARLTDGEYAAHVDVLGEQVLLELVVLVGYYRTMAQLMGVFGVEPPE